MLETRVLKGLGRIAAAGFLDKLHAARYQQHDADDDDRGGVTLQLGHGEHVDVERDQCEGGEDASEGIDERVGDAADERRRSAPRRCWGPTALTGRSAACSAMSPPAVASRAARDSGASLGAMGGGEYGVLGHAGCERQGDARAARALEE
ncbi:MAG: hypothetical protein ACLU7D_11705 [Collinsella sp.]